MHTAHCTDSRHQLIKLTTAKDTQHQPTQRSHPVGVLHLSHFSQKHIIIILYYYSRFLSAIISFHSLVDSRFDEPDFYPIAPSSSSSCIIVIIIFKPRIRKMHHYYYVDILVRRFFSCSRRINCRFGGSWGSLITNHISFFSNFPSYFSLFPQSDSVMWKYSAT